MEWAILISIVLLYGGKFVLTADAFLQGSELHQRRQGTHRLTRPVTGRLAGEVSLNDFSRMALRDLVQNLQNTGHLETHGTGQIPSREQSSKVDWKREGF